MTIGLTYNDDLSRVQIAVTDLPFTTGTIRIEWSTNELYWQTVRGADALAVEASAAAVDHYEFTPDVENFYRVVPIDPVPGLHLNGAAGSYASTPDHASLRITGDIDLRVDAALTTWSGFGQMLVAKSDHTTNNRSYALSEDAGSGDSRSAIEVSLDGSGVESDVSDETLPVSDGDRLALRGTRASGTGDTDLYTAASGVDGPWTALGDTGTTAAGSIFAGDAPLEVGSWADGQFFNAEGIIFAAQVRDGIDGTIVADPDFTDQTMGAAGLTDDAGRAWTIHGDAYLVGTETASITPSLNGRVQFKCIEFPFLNRWVQVTDWSPIARAFRGSVHQVTGRSHPVAVTDKRGSATFTIDIATRDLVDPSFDPLEEARDLDLIIAAGSTYFIQVPAGSDVPGGYVVIDGEVSRRPGPSRRAGVTSEILSLPCTIVAAPGPGVVGGTMTYGALLSLYGSYQNVLNANPTYAALLDLMASPDDLVVL